MFGRGLLESRKGTEGSPIEKGMGDRVKVKWF